jgi:hypothetical protein
MSASSPTVDGLGGSVGRHRLRGEQAAGEGRREQA